MRDINLNLVPILATVLPLSVVFISTVLNFRGRTFSHDECIWSLPGIVVVIYFGVFYRELNL